MSAASLGRGLLMTVLSVLAACGDLALPQLATRAASDTTSDPPVETKTPAPRRTRDDRAKGGNEEESFASMRSSLRRLLQAEVTFFAENGAYSEDLPLIGFTPDRSVTTRFLWISPEGWAASATHPALEGKDCVIFVGQAQTPPTTLKYVRHAPEGVPVCDDSSPSPRPVAKGKPLAAPLDTGSALDALDPMLVMKVDLRNLVQSQKTYFATQGIYARRTEPLALQYLWHRNVRVKILAADAQSWAAKATHAKLPGKSCVIWFGLVENRPVTEAHGRQADRSGVPACDE